MKVILQARGLWTVIEIGPCPDDDADYRDDRLALEAILRSVPREMLATLAVKETAKEAWNSIKTIRLGVDRVRKAKAQSLRREFDDIRFKDGETVDEFALRLTGMMNNLALLGDDLKEERVVEKFLWVVPPHYAHVALSIETLLDLSELTVEELTGRLKAAEERYGLDGVAQGGSSLLFTHEECMAHQQKIDQAGATGGSSNQAAGGGGRRGGGGGGGRSRGRGGGRGGCGNQNSAGSATRKNDKCRYCNNLGHWARECRKKKHDEEANLAEPDEEEPGLLMVQTRTLYGGSTAGPELDRTAPQTSLVTAAAQVFLNEERARVELQQSPGDTNAAWYLDTGASNHMTSDASVFADLDESVTGSVKFGDGSLVDIRGRGTVLFAVAGGHHRGLTNVYWIPRLKSSIISIGQLDQVGCAMLVEHGTMTVRDRQKNLLVKVTRSAKRVYILHIKIVKPACLPASECDGAGWGLERMARAGMVTGLPLIVHAEQICEACLAGKQRRASFPQAAKYSATEPLELVHGDICGPISPATPGGKRYFLLLVYDHSRYTWLVLLRSKDEAAEAIRRFKAAAETMSRHSLHTFRTDRGGEFTSTAFAEYCADHGVQRHLTAPYSPQQNGVVERRNLTVMGMARSMLKARGMPAFFWGEAITTAVFLMNRSYTRSLARKTPFEAWYDRKPNMHFLRVFGCVAHVKDTRPHLAKLADRSKAMVFVGYELGGKAYRAYDPATKRVHVTHDVVFDERASWDWQQE
uniref:Retrovirus-related Pol polyprotein from transposon TNT 1-94 n=1 Tax=Triticum urartu TaxID=4572 RepID=A0A8R7TXP5_TRIUA